MMPNATLRALGHLALVAVLGCGAPARDQPVPPATPTAAPGPTADVVAVRADVVALRARADQSLAASWPLDDARPVTRHDDDRSATAAQYLEACRGGDQQACWIAGSVGGWSVAVTAAVHDNCRAGDQLSCRALPQERVDAASPAFADVPGEAGRSVACNRSTASKVDPACDLAALRKECTLGFSHSCAVISERPDVSSTERDAFHERAHELAREGCRARIDRECGEQMVRGKEADEREIDERMCPQQRVWCGNLSLFAEQDGDLVRARDLAERVCQYGADDSAMSCLVLAGSYLEGRLPEPSPGRGEALRSWACSQPRVAESHRACARLAKPVKRATPR